MFNLEGLIPKLCQLAQEIGEDERALCLRSAGLQALSYLVLLLSLVQLLLILEVAYSFLLVYMYIVFLLLINYTQVSRNRTSSFFLSFFIFFNGTLCRGEECNCNARIH